VFIGKSELHVEWNVMFLFACGSMAALNTGVEGLFFSLALQPSAGYDLVHEVS
jgi:hypothetical protein